MNDGDDRKIILETMVAETARLGDAIAERHAAAERFISVAGALAGVGLTLGLFQNQKPILIGLPTGMAIIMLYMIQIYTDASMHSGHRQALEARLKKDFGQNVLVGQGIVAAKHARRPSVFFTSILILVVWIGTFALGWWAVVNWPPTSRDLGWLFLGLYIFLFVFAAGIIVQAVLENRRAESAAQAAAEGAWPEPSTI